MIDFRPLYFLIIALFLFQACTEDMVYPDCTAEVLAQLEMSEYKGQEIGCSLFLELFEYQGKAVFQLGGHCISLESPPFDCSFEPICKHSNTSNSCDHFARNAVNLGIIGIKN